jgi:tetratricopeptide (TPR) repeat protein
MIKKFRCFTFSVFIILVIVKPGISQKNGVERLEKQIAVMPMDTVRVDSLYELAYNYNSFDPLKAMSTAKDAIQLSKKLHYKKGEVKSLNVLATAYRLTGNFNKALDNYLDGLRICEEEHNSRSMAIQLMNIGILYAEMNDPEKSLPYYLKSDSIIRQEKIGSLYYYNYQNLGDLYERMNRLDSAFHYYGLSLKTALEQPSPDHYLIGASYQSLGNCYIKQPDLKKGLENAFMAMSHLELAGEEDLYSKAAYQVAQIHAQLNHTDSAFYYGRMAKRIAEKGQFQSRLLEVSLFLSEIYKKNHQPDSALAYLEKANMLRDSIAGTEKIKELQQKTFGEEIRQAEIAEKKRKEEEERRQEIQYLIIGIFIPAFFLLTLLLSRRKTHKKLIQVLGILSLLLVFEFLTLVLHPFVLEITHHTPFLELLIFVGIAAILVPAHHRIEGWLIGKLTHHYQQTDAEQLRFTRKKMTIKNHPGE